MKMRKLRKREIDAVLDLSEMLTSIDALRDGHWLILDAPDDIFSVLDEEGFDPDNEQHLKVFYNQFAKLMRAAPHFIGTLFYEAIYQANDNKAADAERGRPTPRSQRPLHPHGIHHRMPRQQLTEEETSMPMVHPCRLIGKAQLLDCEGQLILEVDCNHHLAYYQAIFSAMEQAAAKNNDYAGGCESHPLANFMQTEDSGIPPKIGLWVRMTDKIGRIKTFFRTGKLAVKDEPVKDAFSDLGNYAFLMLALLADEEAKNVGE